MEYVMHCLICGSTKDLKMFPHRKNGNMVGWVFCCDTHEEHELPETLQFDLTHRKEEG